MVAPSSANEPDASGTSGYTPSESRFSLPLKRYLSRQDFASARRNCYIESAAIKHADRIRPRLCIPDGAVG